VTKYKNISGDTIRGPFIPAEYAEAGEVVDLPDEQLVYWPDGEVIETIPLIHPEDIWEPVKKTKAAKAADDEPAKADGEAQS
jgi:hypothetical protein